MTRSLLLGCAGIAPVVVAACAAREPIGVTRISAARYVGNDDAVLRVARARCERERGCGNVGPGRALPDHAACVREAGRLAEADLRRSACPRGIDEAKLGACLADVRDERCGESIASSARGITCAQRELCIGR